MWIEDYNLPRPMKPIDRHTRAGKPRQTLRARIPLFPPAPRWAVLIALLIIVARAATAAPQPRPLDPIAAKMEPDRKILYKTVGDRELYLNLFDPTGFNPTDKRPAYVAIHGGGWTGMNPRYFYPFADHFAKLGMVGVSIEYRLASKARRTTVFDCVKDARSAMRYIRSHAAELGIHPDKIVVAGGSAGGHLASSTSLFPNVNEVTDDLGVSPEAAAMILYYPVIDTSAKGYGQKKIGDRWKELSPVDNVRPGLPPTLLLHGTGDTVTPFPGAKLFTERMKAAGNEIQLITHKDGRHGYFIFDLKLFAEAMKQTETFLKEQKLLDE